MFFLRRELWIASLVEARQEGRDDYWKRWKKAAYVARENDLDARCLAGEVPDPSPKPRGQYLAPILVTDVISQNLKKLTRRNTLSLIRELAQTAKSPTVKGFLRSYLTGRGFYRYYRQAGESKLQVIHAEIENQLLAVDDQGQPILKRQGSHSRPGRNRAHFGMSRYFHVVSLSR